MNGVKKYQLRELALVHRDQKDLYLKTEILTGLIKTSQRLYFTVQTVACYHSEQLLPSQSK